MYYWRKQKKYSTENDCWEKRGKGYINTADLYCTNVYTLEEKGSRVANSIKLVSNHVHVNHQPKKGPPYTHTHHSVTVRNKRETAAVTLRLTAIEQATAAAGIDVCMFMELPQLDTSGLYRAFFPFWDTYIGSICGIYTIYTHLSLLYNLSSPFW